MRFGRVFPKQLRGSYIGDAKYCFHKLIRSETRPYENWKIVNRLKCLAPPNRC